MDYGLLILASIIMVGYIVVMVSAHYRYKEGIKSGEIVDQEDDEQAKNSW